jgi:hypothetical protein
MREAKNCAECGAPLPDYWPKGLCSRCAFDGVLALADGATERSASGLPVPDRKVASNSSTSPIVFTRFGGYELIEEIARGEWGLFIVRGRLA